MTLYVDMSMMLNGQSTLAESYANVCVPVVYLLSHINVSIVAQNVETKALKCTRYDR